MAIISGGGSTGGGSQPEATASITTSAATFLGAHDFDLAGPAAGLVAVTVTAITADGETFGAAGSGHPGFIIEDASGNGPGWSSDGVTYNMGAGTSALSGFMRAGDAPGFAVAQVFAGLFATPRYLRVPVGIFDADGFTPYSGIHVPRLTVRVDLVYSTPA